MEKNIEYTVRHARREDIPLIRKVYDSAKSYMDETGNSTQWKPGHPSDDIVILDIEKENLYLLCSVDGNPHAVFAAIPGKDPTYAHIDGAWQRNMPYVAVHRVGSDGFFRGVMTKVTSFVHEKFSGCDIRIDTHRNNRVMKKALSDNGFVFCGIIYLLSGDARDAYQKVFSE